ncbi:MAG TPA: flagellar filament capping protein FliD [Actinophytocola sp.]|uniref:flagellar filament capping protein FliD n=1 Tax=Actinophytocola sp. TaxID=1872138 RepID=UPI002DB5AFA7|nr:flagellar filament capping protein FliD [Actinophytocola sp.]HEU5474204.1 flagellar filament capping protein FliD [Actinophytocola sp.]
MASVDGLVTGLDTTSIISQLMQLEAMPQTRLKNQVSAQQTVQSSYQAINARMMAVRNAAQALTTATTWQAVTATSSTDAVTASAGATGQAGSTTFDVVRLAAAHVATSTGSGAPAAGGSIDLTIGGKTTTITVGTNTAQGVADAVNNAKLGVRAAVLNTTTGPVLQFSAQTTGAASAFTITGLTDPVVVQTAGADAEIAVGAHRITSADNTFKDLIPGVTIKVNKIETGVTVSSAPDVNKLADAMQALVTAINATVTDINTKSAPGTGGKGGGALQADSLVRSLRGELLSGISSGIDKGAGVRPESLAPIGVQLDRYGVVQFDREKFLAAYQADPAKLQSTVSTGFAKTYETMANRATNSTDGRITQAIQGVQTSVRRMNNEIFAWDARLTAKKASLQRQYSGLEVALGKLKDQSSWLAGQLAGLPNS